MSESTQITGPETANGGIRLQKWLSQAGVCSRRTGEVWIREGRVRVNGLVVTELGTRIDPQSDRVEVNGKPVRSIRQLLYIALNKPGGYVTSLKQPGEKLVTKLVRIPERIYPIGRLDKASTGLLLLTNDGRLHHRLSHPSFDHEKEYRVTVAAPISDEHLQRLSKGMPILGSPTRPADVVRVSDRRFRITLKEGRNRQIRRMLEALGHRVVELQRIRMANIRLGRLPEGKWRYLSDREVAVLLTQCLGNGCQDDSA
ncbi:pseudouridine synthase [Desulfatirhabdium butyrativorans]|uniref:pseudouridine synthase n=1 Tax=Desulfatirhabdium butyrativorans TaxID=340467 RepID=UPI00041CFED0|nr:pseudouridine synthase [Desulfatirhabdium butyrativorans]